MSPRSATSSTAQADPRLDRARAGNAKQGASSGFKYGRAVGAIEAAIALSSIPVEIVEPSVWKRFDNSRQGQGRRPAASPATVSGRACGARAQERPWPGRGIVDRALRSQVMNAPLKPAHSPFGGCVAARILRCPARSGSSRRCRRICANLRSMPIAARRSTRRWRSARSTRSASLDEPRRRDDQWLHDHE